MIYTSHTIEYELNRPRTWLYTVSACCSLSRDGRSSVIGTAACRVLIGPKCAAEGNRSRATRTVSLLSPWWGCGMGRSAAMLRPKVVEPAEDANYHGRATRRNVWTRELFGFVMMQSCASALKHG